MRGDAILRSTLLTMATNDRVFSSCSYYGGVTLSAAGAILSPFSVLVFFLSPLFLTLTHYCCPKDGST